MTSQAAQTTKRITAIDTLRGFALLGILLMNIMSFSMPDAAYNNPAVYGGNNFLNRMVHGLIHTLADQKFMALFSMLFGASVMLLFSKMTSEGKKAARIHYRRNAWLFLFGLLHGIFIWEGDVLLIYGACAFFLYFFRNFKPTLQLALGLIIFFLPSVSNLVIATQLGNLDGANIQTLQASFSPNEATINKDLALYQSNYQEQLNYRLTATTESSNAAQNLMDISILTEAFGRAFGMMLIGMAFYTLGIITGKRNRSFYVPMLIIGFSVGLPLALFGLYQYYAHNWNASYALFIGRIPNHLATPFIASGYLALIMLWSQTKLFTQLQNALMNVGRMALSNYIGQSLLATFIFYGFGLGLYGSVNRLSQLSIVIIIWIIQMLSSKLWMTRFRYGPLEWLWRSLTYMRLEPLRKQALQQL